MVSGWGVSLLQFMCVHKCGESDYLCTVMLVGKAVPNALSFLFLYFNL